MTVRSKRSTQEGTGEWSPERRRAGLGTPPHGAGAAMTASSAATQGEPWELVTEVTPRPVPADLTEGFAPRPAGEAGRVPTPHLASLDQAAPTELTARPERSEPLRVISMKDRVEGGVPRAAAEPRVPLHVQLRTMAEVAGVHDPAGPGRADLGHLAPPHDPRQARMRRRRADLAWACVAVALAGGITLAIWLIAGR